MNTLLDCCTKAVQMMEKVMHYVCEANATNWQDTINVFIVCAAICFIVRYGVRRYFRYKTFESNKHEEFEILKRSWEVEDIERKTKAELLSKKLETLKGKPEYIKVIDDELGAMRTPAK